MRVWYFVLGEGVASPKFLSRNEAENCTDTGYDTVINKTEEPRCKMWFKEFM